MAFRISNAVFFIIPGLMFYAGVAAKTGVGDWIFQIEGAETAVEKRLAFTRAQPDPGNRLRPRLVIRRAKPDSPVDLMITGTHDTENDNCDYRDWKIVIDRTEVPVLGYTFEPAKTELKAKLGTPADDLWHLVRQGLTLTVEVEQKCDSTSGVFNPVRHSFSLSGSFAAYQFVSTNSR